MIQKENLKPLFFFFCKFGCLLASLCVVIALITPIIVPKYTEAWAPTAVVEGLYELEENSLDVLIIGSSQVVSAISPMQIYAETGITSYNLGTEQQGLFVTYYLLQESLRYQKPKVIFLDLMFLYSYSDSPINTSAEFVHKSFDFMHWSEVKLEAISTLCSLDAEHSMRDYFFPFFYYHSRWSELSAEDFTHFAKDKANVLKGFFPVTIVEPSDFEGFEMDTSIEPAVPHALMVEYLDKIATLCAENDISLILIKTPRCDGTFSSAQHNAMQALADYYHIPLIDFNEKELYTQLDFDPQTDYMDILHVNYSGAKKITGYISDYLCTNYAFEDKRQNAAYESWNLDLEQYEQLVPNL